MKKEKKQIVVICGVIKNKNKILLVQRYHPEYPIVHLKWELPGGKISFGENPSKTIERETLEETGYKIKAKKLIPYIHTNVWNLKDISQHTVLISYICRMTGGKEDKSDHRTNDIKWLKYHEINWQQTLPGTKEIIDNAKKIK